MPNLAANFKADLRALARKDLSSQWGNQATDIADESIVRTWLDARRRRPEARSRRLHIAEEFICPTDLDVEWLALQAEVAQGAELWPRMSGSHSSLKNRDGLLNEWDVHHFHLGAKPKDGGAGLSKRTDSVVFARVTSDDFYAINVYRHREWEKTSVLEALHRNWPDSIRGYRLNGSSGEPLTETERRTLRKINLNANSAVTDGTLYMPISGGVAGSGAAIRATIDADILESDVEALQLAVETNLAGFIVHLRRSGYNGEAQLVAKLTCITDVGFQIDFVDFARPFIVTLAGGRYHRGRHR